MSRPFIKFHLISFSYESAIEPLFKELSLHIDSGWTGVIGANGTGKTTLLKLAIGLLQPVAGHVDLPALSVYCPQRTDDMPEKLEEFISTNTKAAGIIKGQLGIADDWSSRWSTLSHGERKRAQIGVALWLEPEVLAIDEPTNHLDSEARENILQTLRAFSGVGLIVSHDRELLDTLCQQCIYIEPPDVIIRRGGVTQVMKTIKEEQESVRKQLKLKKREYKKLQREYVRRREAAKRADKKRSKRGIAKKDHDAKEKVDRALVSGKDGAAGRFQKQMQGRLDQAQKFLDNLKVTKDYTPGIWLPGSYSKRNFLVNMEANHLMLGKNMELEFSDLSINPTDRIALTGPNGAGKSTLVRHIISSLNVPQEHVTYIPQEIELERAKEILEQVLSLPEQKLGYLMTIVSRLGSMPHRLLESTEPSPGETRKLLLALGMTREPHIIIMDEPTNHLDLSSIECLEQALEDCPCALLLVSHDKYFLEKLTSTRWDICKTGQNYRLQIM